MWLGVVYVMSKWHDLSIDYSVLKSDFDTMKRRLEEEQDRITHLQHTIAKAPQISGQGVNKPQLKCEPENKEYIEAGRDLLDFYRLTRLAGPRKKIWEKKNLLAISCGSKGMQRVNAIVDRFGTEDFDIILFHYDKSDWTRFDWFDKVTHVVSLKQMKFWFAKRFLLPDLVHRYNYIFLWDEDPILTKSFDPLKFIDILDNNNLELASPAYPNYGYPIVTPHFGLSGRYTSFVEVGFPVFSTTIWPCVWHLMFSDLVTGSGIDRVWRNCALDSTGIVDGMPIRHASLGSFSKTKYKNIGLAEEKWVAKRIKKKYPKKNLLWSKNPHKTFREFTYGPKFGNATLIELWQTDPKPPKKMPDDIVIYP